MAIQHAYATTNLLSGLTLTSSATWSSGSNGASRVYLNDGRLDRVSGPGSVSGGVSLTLDLGSAQSVSVVAMLNSNIASATSPSVVIQGADDSGISSGVVTAKASTSLNTTAPSHKDHALQFAAVSKRYWRIAWTWSGSFSLTVGEVFVGASTALSRATQYGTGGREEYVTSKLDTYTGDSRSHYIAGPIRSRDIEMSDLSTTERNEVMAMFRACRGGATKILWLEQYQAVSTAATSAYQDCIYGRMTESTLAWVESDFGLYAPDLFTIRSLGREVGA